MADVLITRRGRQAIRNLPRRANEGDEATFRGKPYRYIRNKWVQIVTSEDQASSPLQPRSDSEIQELINASISDLLTRDEIVDLIESAISDLLTRDEIVDLIESAVFNLLTRDEIVDLIGEISSGLSQSEVETLIQGYLSAPVWSAIPEQDVGHNENANINLNDHVTSHFPDTITASGLPSGLSVSDGIITGSSTTSGTHQITVTASNIFGESSQQFNIVVANVAPSWQTVPTQDLEHGGNANINLNAYAGGSPTPTITVTGLPSGLSLANGRITGSSTVTGTHAITATATNSEGSSDTTFNIVIAEDAVQLWWDNNDGVWYARSTGGSYWLDAVASRQAPGPAFDNTVTGAFPIDIRLLDRDGASSSEGILFAGNDGNFTLSSSGSSARLIRVEANATVDVYHIEFLARDADGNEETAFVTLEVRDQ